MVLEDLGPLLPGPLSLGSQLQLLIAQLWHARSATTSRWGIRERLSFLKEFQAVTPSRGKGKHGKQHRSLS